MIMRNFLQLALSKMTMKKEQIIGIYCSGNSEDGIEYYFQEITNKEYQSLLYEVATNSLEAAFIISPKEFEKAKGANWGINTKAILYIDRILINSNLENRPIHDVLSDFMVITADERGAKVLRVKTEHNAQIAKTIHENGYTLVVASQDYSLFEVEVELFGQE